MQMGFVNSISDVTYVYYYLVDGEINDLLYKLD